MDYSQFWPSQTQVGHQTLAGARLQFVPEKEGSDTSAGLRFEFARLDGDDVTLQTEFPPVKVFPSSIEPVGDQGPPKNKFRLIQDSNNFLRGHYPEVDLPKRLLLEHILEDMEQKEEQKFNRSPALTGLVVEDRKRVIISAGGASANELYCSFLISCKGKQSPQEYPQFRASSQPILTLRTPVQQVSSGSSLDQDKEPVFLVRTYDSTTLLSYSSPCGQMSALDSSNISAGSEFKPISQLKTSDTAKTAHLDACMGHPVNDWPQLFVLDQNCVLWRTRPSEINPTRVGQMRPTDSVSRNIVTTWGRCGIYPTNDCLVVADRKRIALIDHRLGSGSNDLYVASNDHPITDLQRFISFRSPHLRAFLTTSSILHIDDRWPGKPVFDIKHFRAPDLSLSMAFATQMHGDQVTVDEYEKQLNEIMLWSRANDVTSLYRLRSNMAAPPNLIGQSVGLPFSQTNFRHRRAGLLFSRHEQLDPNLTRLSLVEMTDDGALWHQQLGLGPALSSNSEVDSIDIPVHGSRPFPRYVWDEALIKKDAVHSRTLYPLEITGGGADLIPSLSSVCRDFSRIRLDQTHDLIRTFKCTLGLIETNHASHSTDTVFSSLGHEAANPSGDLLGSPPQTSPNSRRGSHSVINLQPFLKALLLDPDRGSISIDSCPKERVRASVSNTKEEVDQLLDRAIASSLYTRSGTTTRNDVSEDSAILNEEIQRSDVVDYLMDDWKSSSSFTEHRWGDLGPGDSMDVVGDFGRNASAGFHSRSQSRQTSVDHSIQPIIEVNKTPKMFSNSLETPSRNSANRFTIGSGSQQSPSSHMFSQVPSLSRSQIQNRFEPIESSQTISFSFNEPKEIFSQILPGPHGGRNPPASGPVKKKKRLGGF